MEKIVCTAPLQIPRIWADLLALDDFEELTPYPAKARDVIDDPVHVTDPTPYRDDARTVSVREGNYTVMLHLLSGNGGYWLIYEVWRDDVPVYEGGDYVYYELPVGREEVELEDGTTLVFDTVTV